MRYIRFTIETVAGILLGLVALLTVVEMSLRYFLGVQLPDAYSFAGYAQAIAVFWGIAIAFLDNSHIAVDILWEHVSRLWRKVFRRINLLVCTLFMSCLTYMMVQGVLDARQLRDATQTLGAPVWPFLAAAAGGALFSVVFIVLRFVQEAIAGNEVNTGGGTDD